MTLVAVGGPGPRTQHNKFNTMSNIHKRGTAADCMALVGEPSPKTVQLCIPVHRYSYWLFFNHPTILS